MRARWLPARRRQRGYIVNPYVFAVGGGSTLEARYWRIHVTANAGAIYISVDKIRFYDDAVAQITTTGKTYIKSSALTADGGNYGADKPFNMGALATGSTGYWAANWSSPQWVGIDFGAAVIVSRVDIGFGSGVGSSERPQDFTLQTSSNGADWTTWDTRTGKTWSTGSFEQFFIP